MTINRLMKEEVEEREGSGQDRDDVGYGGWLFPS